MPTRSPLDIVPRSFFGRVLASLGALVVIVLGFFFLAVALAIAAVIVFVVFVRILWLLHRARRRAERNVIETEYSVSEAPRPPSVTRDSDES